MTAIIAIAGVAVYLILYFTYGKRLETSTVKANNENQTPAHRMFDGVDYVPAKTPVLMGHHFASIAGAAPIVGPVIAMGWGWVPALLWVWFGNIFIGAVHDYLSVMASVRYDGRSVQFVASDVITKRTGRLFYYLVLFLLILVVGAFSNVLGGMFLGDPSVPASYLFLVIGGLILGVIMYRLKWPFGISTAIGIVLLVLAVIGGTVMPIELGKDAWFLIMFFYIIIAAAVPVDVLLQPRDYLNSWLLYAGLAIGGLAALFSFSGFSAPAFTSFSPIVSGGNPTPFWPVIPLIIACGSLSGFHALVGSGTTAKQLDTEKAGLPVGYGTMLFEGFLSTVVVISIAGFGMTVLQDADAGVGAAAWGQEYVGAMEGAYGAAPMFSNSYAAMVDSSFLRFLPTDIVKVVAGMWVASFALTTLDTTNRLARYTLAEIFMPLKDSGTGVYKFFSNRWIASIIPAAIGVWLGWSGNFSVLWPSFGSANQLIASIALLTGTAWVVKRLKGKANVALIPAYLLWITVTAAIIWFSAVVVPGTIENDPVTGYVVLVIELIMLVLNIIFMVDFLKSQKQPAPSESQA
ncbi:MAG: carbon starvation protein A [Spirochaetaceae bacterium]